MRTKRAPPGTRQDILVGPRTAAIFSFAEYTLPYLPSLLVRVKEFFVPPVPIVTPVGMFHVKQVSGRDGRRIRG